MERKILPSADEERHNGARSLLPEQQKTRGLTMIENMQVRKLQSYLRRGMSLSQSALKSGMSESTARKYRQTKILPRDLCQKRTWRTRKDPFENVWSDVYEWLEVAPQLTATDIFRRLQRDRRTAFSGCLATLQRGIKKWRSSRGVTVQSRETSSRRWMHDLLHGKTSVEKIQDLLSNTTTGALLCTELRNGRVSNRKKSLTILAAEKGIPNSVIAKFLNLDPKTTQRYRELFLEAGTAGLFSRQTHRVCKSDEPHYVDAVIATLHTPPSTYGINRTTWMQGDLQRILCEQGIRISMQNIRAILRKAGYRWRKAKRVLTSTDPKYKEKLAAITSILSAIRPTARFFSIDEFGPFSIAKKSGRKLIKPGEDHSVPQRQQSRGRLIISAALELCTNQMTHFYSDRKNTDEMIRLVDVLTKEYVGMETLYLSWDAASWHMSRRFYEHVASINVRSPRDAGVPQIELVPLPACAQFLNVIESVFSGMARAIIHNSDYASEEVARQAIDRYFADRNDWFRKNPKRAGNKIWGRERTIPIFSEANNCKDPKWR